MSISEAFRLAENNAYLSDADPSGNTHYEDIKARIIAGQLTYEKASEEILLFHMKDR